MSKTSAYVFEDHCYLKKGICMRGSVILYCGIELNGDLLINKSNLMTLTSLLLTDKGT